MTVEQHTVVDFAGMDTQGNFVLTISDHLPWGNVSEHLFCLQEKLNAYLRFIEAGELLKIFPEAIGLPILISVSHKYPVPQEAQWFFEKAEAAIRGIGLQFEVRYFVGT